MNGPADDESAGLSFRLFMTSYTTTDPRLGDSQEVLLRKLVQLLGGRSEASDSVYNSLWKIVDRIALAEADADNGVALGDTEYVLARKLLILVNAVP